MIWYLQNRVKIRSYLRRGKQENDNSPINIHLSSRNIKNYIGNYIGNNTVIIVILFMLYRKIIRQLHKPARASYKGQNR